MRSLKLKKLSVSKKKKPAKRKKTEYKIVGYGWSTKGEKVKFVSMNVSAEGIEFINKVRTVSRDGSVNLNLMQNRNRESTPLRPDRVIFCPYTVVVDE